MTTRRYTYRAYPDAAQQAHLARIFGCCRVVYNDALRFREIARSQGRSVCSGDVSANLTASKRTPEREWLNEVSAVALQQSIAEAERAWRNFFGSVAGRRRGRKMGVPRMKRRGTRQSARFTRNSMRVRETTHDVGFVRLTGLGEIRYAKSRPLPSEPSSVTVILESDGTYHLSFVVQVPSAAKNDEAPQRASGVDLGIGHIAVIASTDGTREKVANPRHLREAERRLTAAQRRMSRKQRGSANREKARLVLAKHHSRVRRSRLDHHHKLARRIVHENQVVVLEGLAVSALARSRMSKSVTDAGWGRLVALIKEKAEARGRTVIVLGRNEPTSQVCSACGVRDGKKPLHVREWTCSACGARLDRDYNAAVNILLAGGQSESLNACGPGVRLRLAGAIGDEAGTRQATAA